MRTYSARTLGFVLVVLLLVVLIGCQSVALRSAKIRLQNQDYAGAKELLLQGVEQTPKDPELWYTLGKVHAHFEEWAEMNEAFNKTMELTESFNQDIEDTRYEAWRQVFNQAIPLMNNQEYDKALEVYQEALVIHPGEPKTLTQIGLIYLQKGEFELAEDALDEAVVNSEELDIRLLFNLMQIKLQLEKNEEVLELADRIISEGGEELEPSQLNDARQRRALALQRLGREDEAIEEWDLAIAENPENADFYFNKAFLMHTLERYNEAAQNYMKVLELTPEDDEARQNAARALYGAEDWEGIVGLLEPYLFQGGEVTPENANVSVNSVDMWRILRESYEELGMTNKSDVVTPILVEKVNQQG